MRYRITIRGTSPLIMHKRSGRTRHAVPCKPRKIGDRPQNADPTAPKQTTSDSENSNAKPRFGSTRAERLQSRQPPSGQ